MAIFYNNVNNRLFPGISSIGFVKDGRQLHSMTHSYCLMDTLLVEMVVKEIGMCQYVIFPVDIITEHIHIKKYTTMIINFTDSHKSHYICIYIFFKSHCYCSVVLIRLYIFFFQLTQNSHVQSSR